MQIGKDTVVAFDFTLTDNEGTVLDSSKGHQPFVYLHGAGAIIPGTGKNRSTENPPAKRWPYPSLPTRPMAAATTPWCRMFPATRSQETLRSNPECSSAAQGQNAASRMVMIVAVNGDTIRIDANHPLAGQTLHFEVKIVSVRAATAEEASHKHVHAPGGHQH